MAPTDSAAPPRVPKKKALLIGINYVGQSGELAGCVNDVVDMRAICILLKYDEICILYDGAWPGAATPANARLSNRSTTPSRANIIAAIRWLTADAARGDMLVCHYSGHGSQLRTLIPDSENDGLDETIVPVDYRTAGMIRDDELKRMLVDSLIDKNASLRAIFDCCHAGTGVDLQYNLAPKSSAWGRRGLPAETMKDDEMPSPVAAMVAESVRNEMVKWFGPAVVDRYADPGVGEGHYIEWTADGVQTEIGYGAIASRVVPKHVTDAAPDVILVSGCADNQSSADSVFGGRPGGVLSYFLATYLRERIAAAQDITDPAIWPSPPTLLREMRRRTRAQGYSQIPQLSSESPVEGRSRFNLA